MERSPFQRLPGELRNEIYELALLEPDGVKISLAGRKAKLVHESATYSRRAVAAINSLPATCKAVRAETQNLFFSINKFTFITQHFKQKRSSDFWIRTLQKWTSQIGQDHLSQIKRVSFDLGTWTCTDAPALPRLHMNQMQIIDQLFKIPVYAKMRADLRCPGIDISRINIPLSEPYTIFHGIRQKRKAKQKRLKKDFSDSVHREAYLEMFKSSHKVLDHLLSEMIWSEDGWESLRVE